MKTNIFFFKVVKANTKKGKLEKPKKESLLLLIPGNIGDRKLSLRKTIKYQPNIEKQVFRISGIKYFKRITFFIDCQSYTLLLMNIVISNIFI